MMPEERLLESTAAVWDGSEAVQFYAGQGCEACRYTGFSGRKGIFEYLPIDDEIRSEIARNASTEKIRQVAIEKGMKTLREDGWNKVRSGITTIAEVLRVTLEN